MEIKTTTKQIEIYIKNKILNRELKPGDVIKEAELAEKLNLSRSPIREALFQLRSEGLLTIESKRRKCITKLTKKDIEDSYESAGYIESAIVSSTLHLFSEEDFENLKTIILRFNDSRKNGYTNFFDIDDEFHNYLLSKSSNKTIKRMHRRSCRNISKFLLCNTWRRAFTGPELYDRHFSVIKKLETGDRFLVESSLRHHYFETAQRMIETENIS
ncbi:MAG: GntR family transcriptional regulator [Desulfotignum sp.]|nr:GntR family transcriptional regulator [Desulfotignum sp.]MCF8088586.1 GntR family transcriptional regulator [Desulfotignum sp.]MCF8136574.1 GntR family transcriptional regulator [Desulfotignum sp.]